MGLKTVLENLDGVDDTLKAFYIEKEGKFILDIDDVDAHPRVRGLKTANTENVKKRDEYKDKVAELEEKLSKYPSDFDPNEYLQLKSRLGKTGSDGGKDADNELLQSQRQMYETRISTMETKYNDQIADLTKKIERKDRMIAQDKLDGNLRNALIGANVDKNLLDAAVVYLARSGKVHREEHGDEETYRVVIGTDMGEEPIDDFVKSWVKSPQGSPFLAKATGPDPKGGNGAGNLGDNPFDSQGGKIKPNLTKQQDLIVNDPDKARMLAKLVNHPVTW